MVRMNPVALDGLVSGMMRAASCMKRRLGCWGLISGEGEPTVHTVVWVRRRRGGEITVGSVCG